MAIYLVTTPDGKKRLVETRTEAGAINHVAADTIKAQVLKPSEVFQYAKDGLTLEQPKEKEPKAKKADEPEGTQPLPQSQNEKASDKAASVPAAVKSGTMGLTKRSA